MTDSKHSSNHPSIRAHTCTHSAPSPAETACSGANGCRAMEHAYRFPLNETRKAQSLDLIRLEASRKRIRRCPAMWEQLFNQFRFHSRKYWILQSILLLAAMSLALALRRQTTDGIETLAVCSVFLVFAGNICLSHVADLFSWHMAELEQTLYLNLKQMVCIRMLEAGLANLIMLALLLCITGGKNPAGPVASLLYMLVPFLWSDALYLHMLTSLRSSASSFRSLALGLLCGTLTLFPVLWENIYLPQYLIVWQILAAAGLFLLIAEIYRLLGRIETGDSICQN